MKRLLTFIFAAMLLMPAAMAQEDLQKGAEPFGEKKTFTTIKENPITSVKNQYRSGTCWDYIQLYSAPSVIVSGEDGNYALEATLIAENGITYLIEVNRLKEGVTIVRSDARPLKRIVNGQLMIEKNGITYTVQGTELK